MRTSAKISAVIGLLLAGCGGVDDSGPAGMSGVWTGTSASGLSVTLQVEREVSVTASVAALHGVLTIGDPRCLRSTPFSGTHTRDVLEISASGAGTVSASTFVDINGLHSGNRVDGTLELSGDGKLEACDLGRHALTLVK